MSEKTTVLIVEDDEILRDAMCDTVKYGGYQAIPAAHGGEALEVLDERRVDLVISDVEMDVMDGHALLGKVRARRPELPFVLVTAHGCIERAVSAMREGATDYLIKPFEAEVLLEVVSRFERVEQDTDIGMVAEDPVMAEMCELVARVARSSATVLISGESGTGKEVMARYVHSRSERHDAPFIAINCAAIPEPMLESMLFGYEKGAYTGAYQSRAGKFEQANGGTLLLDEISEMELGLQAKLLRVLQEREVERLGGNALIPLDVRVIATTNRNLKEEVAAGNFREDLYYRLNVFPVSLPPLRNRPGDILPLAKLMLVRYAQDRPLSLGSAAELKLLQHRWQGNVRELDNCIQRAAILCAGNEVRGQDIYFEDDFVPDAERPAAGEATVNEAEPLLNGGLKDKEKQMIVTALETVDGSRKDAAKLLGISPRTLRYKLARLKEQGVAIPAVG